MMYVVPMSPFPGSVPLDGWIPCSGYTCFTIFARISINLVFALNAWYSDGLPGGGVSIASFCTYSSSISLGYRWSTSSFRSTSGNPRSVET